jgi:hypothetical protein
MGGEIHENMNGRIGETASGQVYQLSQICLRLALTSPTGSYIYL